MLNRSLDRAALAAKFREDGRIRIETVLDPEIAERIRAACINDVPFQFVAYIDGKNVKIPPEEMAKFDPERFREFQGKLLDSASKGIGFFYGGYLMAHKLDDTSNERMQFLHSVFEYLNSEEMLSFIREITGNDELKSADAQYTRFTPGQFLTRHRDENTTEQRRFAYVLGFSRNWHPDWGGLLQFFEDDGTPRDAWAPTFNSMSLFDVKHVHSVTFVAPFALEPRLSLTGWFRAKAG
jgi:Rps23 Pro-64 3,4-dihydroxylase Tpa1-like proline 4-hydroxylase